jgi:hypothetical protein
MYIQYVPAMDPDVTIVLQVVAIGVKSCTHGDLQFSRYFQHNSNTLLHIALCVRLHNTCKFVSEGHDFGEKWLVTLNFIGRAGAACNKLLYIIYCSPGKKSLDCMH